MLDWSKIIGRQLPNKCYNTNEYKEKKLFIDEKNIKINPFKPSCTHFYKLNEYNINGHIFTLLKCILITGRTHQVRLHLQHLGMAVVGDRIYPRLKDNKHAVENNRKYRPRYSDKEFYGNDVQIEKELFNENECKNIDWYNSDYHALHAHSSKFNHPTTNKQLNFKAELPPFFKSILLTLQGNFVTSDRCKKKLS